MHIMRLVLLHTPILPSCNYCGIPTHKATKCNIPSDFVIIVGKRDINKLFVLPSS
jgi:hypothetical protein